MIYLLKCIWILFLFSHVKCQRLRDMSLPFFEPERFRINASAFEGGKHPDCRLTSSEPLKVCQKQLIFDGHFLDQKINEKDWKIAQYIPASPDYEFCSYEKKNEIIFTKEGNLVIKPIPATKNDDVRGSLDLRNGCTSRSESECLATEDCGFILPPVKSAKIKSNLTFKYGIVKIKAKLPAGDWLYPEIYLESNKDECKKIRIAYARGNRYLVYHVLDGKNKSRIIEIGGQLLSGGPLLSCNEPDRSKYFSTRRAKEAFYEDFHEYSLVWMPDQILLFIDEAAYGVVAGNIPSLFDEPMHVVLGVGVGGLTDFPDNCLSSTQKRKPWKDADRLINKNFFKARNDWLPTWTNDGSSLKVEYVKVWAL